MGNGADDFNDDLSGGAPTFKFDTLGDTVKGMITEVEKRQQTDLKTKELKTWNDGSPMWQYVISLADGSEEGTRIFAKGQMLTAIREAVKASPEGKLEVGGQLAVKWDSEGEPPERGFNPPKLYVAQYKAPEPQAASVDADDLL